jgi:transposase-like protein
MREECSMTKQKKSRRARRSFSPEFKADVVRLCQSNGEKVGDVAKRLSLTEAAVRAWVKRAGVDAGGGARHPKKSDGLLREGGFVSRYEFIRVEKAFYPVTVLCRVLEVVRSAYYTWCCRVPTARDKRNAVLALQVQAVHTRSKKRYGSPRVRERLAGDWVRVSRKKVASLMRKKQSNWAHEAPIAVLHGQPRTESIAPNLLARNFTTTAPNQVWVTDVTELPTRTGSVFLAAIIDLFSRRVVGWALSESNDTALARSLGARPRARSTQACARPLASL